MTTFFVIAIAVLWFMLGLMNWAYIMTASGGHAHTIMMRVACFVFAPITCLYFWCQVLFNWPDF